MSGVTFATTVWHVPLMPQVKLPFRKPLCSNNKSGTNHHKLNQPGDNNPNKTGSRHSRAGSSQTPSNSSQIGGNLPNHNNRVGINHLNHRRDRLGEHHLNNRSSSSNS